MYTVFCLQLCLQARRRHQISLQMVMSHMFFPGIELRTSGRAVSALNLWATSPAPVKMFLKDCTMLWNTVFVLGSLLSTLHKLQLSEKREPQLKTCFHKVGLEASLCWSSSEGSAHSGWCHSWAGCPGLCNKADWASHREQVRKQHSSMASASVPTLHVPALTSRWCTTIYRFPLQVAFGHGVSSQQ